MWLRWVVSNLLNQVAEDKVRHVVEQAKQAVEPALRNHLQRPAAPVEDSAPDAASAAVSDSPPDLAAPCRLVVLFALGLESGGLVDQMSNGVMTRCATFVERSGQLNGKRLVICESGVGQSAAARATEDIIKVFQPQWIVSAGFAGALTSELQRGHIVMADSLIDQQRRVLEVGLQIDPAAVAANRSLHVGRLLTVDHLIRYRQEKEQLAAEYGAIACDMETMAVAQACRQQQVRFLSVRIISDQLDDKLPLEVEHMLGQQSLAGKLGAATRALWDRPGSVKDMWKLRETALRASDRLAKFLVGTISQLEE